MESHSKEIGDSMIRKIELDYEKKQIVVHTTRFLEKAEEKNHIVFENVYLHFFEDFANDNVLSDIEDVGLPALKKNFRKVFERYVHYAPDGIRIKQMDEAITKKGLKCYEITPCAGLGGFVVAQSISINRE